MRIKIHHLLSPLFLLLNFLPPLSPSPSCSYNSSESGLVLSCTGLNTTADIPEEEIETVKSVVSIEISESNLDCLDLSHFLRFHHLKQIKVTKSGLKKAICSDSRVRHRKAAEHLRFLRSLDLSFNSLSSMDRSINSLNHLERINLSNNNLSQINMVFTTFTQLKYLNISNNNLADDLQRQTLETLPSTLKYLDLTGNPWTCTPSLSWLYPWSLTMSPSIRDQLDQVTCNVINSHQISPLRLVMQYYTHNVNPYCPHKCSCYFYHFATSLDTSPSYTVLVNCSMLGLTIFPTLPPHTTMLNLSHNNLSDLSYSSLDVAKHNYGELTGLILSHNQLTAIHTKLTKLKLHRVFKADHNNITEIPYDFSLLLQSYPKNKITLGHNPWRCSCNAEITSLNLLARLEDQEELICVQGLGTLELAGKKISDLDPYLLCPPSSEGQTKEFLLQLLCLVLAMVNMFIFSKLLYDYWQYKSKGKLPRIVHWLPYL